MIWTAFIIGFFGSLTHCAGMCGPLALALPQMGETRSRFLLGRIVYNVGRLITYGFLGLLFGLAGHVLLLAGVQRWVSIGLGAAILAGLLTSRHWALSRPVVAVVNRLKGQMGMLLRSHSLSSLALLGLLNGLLPCGLVYLACTTAAAAGSASTAVLSMLAFGIGTFPMMLAISLSGRLVPISFRLRLARAVPFAILCLAMLLIFRGLSLGIPYLSPELSSTGASCCHR